MRWASEVVVIGFTEFPILGWLKPTLPPALAASLCTGQLTPVIFTLNSLAVLNFGTSQESLESFEASKGFLFFFDWIPLYSKSCQYFLFIKCFHHILFRR